MTRVDRWVVDVGIPLGAAWATWRGFLEYRAARGAAAAAVFAPLWIAIGVWLGPPLYLRLRRDFGDDERPAPGAGPTRGADPPGGSDPGDVRP
jgi:hypothetical protein